MFKYTLDNFKLRNSLKNLCLIKIKAIILDFLNTRQKCIIKHHGKTISNVLIHSEHIAIMYEQ